MTTAPIPDPLLPAAPAPEITARIVDAIQGLVTAVPTSNEKQVSDPTSRARHLAYLANTKAAGIAFGLALPPGPLGLLTIIPDLILVWKIQSQLVADIAAAHGKTSTLSPEAMLYCLFKHGGAQLVRDLLMRVGERVFIQRASLQIIQRALQQVGLKITQRVIGKGISRWIPIVGGGVVAAYAWYDTDCVAETAIDLFAHDMAEDNGIQTGHFVENNR